MHTLQIPKKFIDTLPLITRETVNGELPTKEGTLFKLVDSQGEYVATAYYGLQNKGVGWVLSEENEEIDEDFFTRKFRAAFAERSEFYESFDTTAFRVFNGEGDGIGGLTIEFFDGYYVINFYSEGIYAFRHFIYEAIENVADVRAIYEKKRFDTNGQYIEQDDFVRGEPGEFPIIVQENGMNFAVDLNDGAMTGIFLDQRNVRRAIRDKYSEGKEVLNTFAYTGAFSVAAALGGAMKTTSVDVAKRSLPKTIEQFSVNAIDYEAQDIKVMDVFSYFNYAKRHNLLFDLVILDPPSFARTKKVTFSSAKDYPKLLAEAIAITAKNGVIVASTNNASFDMKKFKQMIAKAFDGKKYRILEEHQLPEDFSTLPEFNYLKVVFLQKLK